MYYWEAALPSKLTPSQRRRTFHFGGAHFIFQMPVLKPFYYDTRHVPEGYLTSITVKKRKFK
jgi:hypothetical protein